MTVMPQLDSCCGASELLARERLTSVICRETLALSTDLYRDGLRAVVVTGSLARDEGTFVRQGGSWVLLGDADMLIVFEDGSPLPMTADLDGMTAQLHKRLLKLGLSCDLSLSPVDLRYLRQLRPSIYAYELAACGKIIGGDPSVLGLAPQFSRSEIPLEDAWRLLANRIVEQLDGLKGLDRSLGAIPPQTHYRTVKLYLDMATSLLVFLGNYAPTYAERAAMLNQVAGMASSDDRHPFPLTSFAEDVAAVTRWKLCPSDPAPSVVHHFWERGIAYVQALWQWELARLTERSPSVPPATLMREWTRRQSLLVRLRGWARVVRHRGGLRSAVHWPRWARQACHGSPRYLVYHAASSLLFTVPSMLNTSLSENTLASRLATLRSELPVTLQTPMNAPALSWKHLAEEILANYHEFLVHSLA